MAIGGRKGERRVETHCNVSSNQLMHSLNENWGKRFTIVLCGNLWTCSKTELPLHILYMRIL